MRRLLGCAVLVGVAALGLVTVGGIVGAKPAPVPVSTTATASALETAIAHAQDRLRTVPGDWQTWAALASAYVEQARVSADPTYYPKAQGAAQRSLALQPDGNPYGHIALGALANARHDFVLARTEALAALAVDGYSADAYGVLADAQTQLGNASAATDAVQHMLDLKPGLAAYARASYDLELRGRTVDAADLMRRALAAAVDPHDIAFCRNQLGDLDWLRGDLAGAREEYRHGLAADPTSIALRRGLARVDAAAGNVSAALAGYAEVTDRSPSPTYLVEYADLLRRAGKPDDAARQLDLAQAAQDLFTANGGNDGLGTANLAIARGRYADAVAAARAEWARRRHIDVADTLGWALHLAGQDTEALGYARRVAATGARDASYAYHLGAIEAALHDGAAKADLQRALDTNPYFPGAADARVLLAKVSA